MRLVDAYIDTIIEARDLVASLSSSGVTAEALKFKLYSMLMQSEQTAVANGFSPEHARQATFPVVAMIDEMILTSSWQDRSEWKSCSLQLQLYSTTNAGSEFYERLNTLNRSEYDQSVREVFLFCLGLGFKGKFFMPEDSLKIKEVRSFHVGALLPSDHQSRLEKMTLFSDAYQKDRRENKHIKSRFNVIPVAGSIPVVLVVAVYFFYSTQVNQWVSSIVSLVN